MGLEIFGLVLGVAGAVLSLVVYAQAVSRSERRRMVDVVSEAERSRRRFEEALLYRIEQRTHVEHDILQRAEVASIDPVIEGAIASALTRGGYLPYEELLTLDFDLWSREVSHSLVTPLTHIEVVARNILASRPSAEISNDVNDVVKSVELCKAFLVAFRDIARTSREATSWQPGSLADSVRSGFSVYQERLNRPDVSLDLLAPASLGGYTNTFLLVIVLPLLENAIEASLKGSTVVVSVERSGELDAVLIEVRNTSATKPDPKAMFDTGYSTKGANHQGLGLRIVRDFVARRKGEIQTAISGKQPSVNVLISVRLPIQIEDRRSEKHGQL